MSTVPDRQLNNQQVGDAHAPDDSGRNGPFLLRFEDDFEEGTAVGVESMEMAEQATKANGAVGPATATLLAPSSSSTIANSINSEDDQLMNQLQDAVNALMRDSAGATAWDELSDPDGSGRLQ